MNARPKPQTSCLSFKEITVELEQEVAEIRERAVGKSPDVAGTMEMEARALDALAQETGRTSIRHFELLERYLDVARLQAQSYHSLYLREVAKILQATDPSGFVSESSEWQTDAHSWLEGKLKATEPSHRLLKWEHAILTHLRSLKRETNALSVSRVLDLPGEVVKLVEAMDKRELGRQSSVAPVLRRFVENVKAKQVSLAALVQAGQQVVAWPLTADEFVDPMDVKQVKHYIYKVTNRQIKSATTLKKQMKHFRENHRGANSADENGGPPYWREEINAALELGYLKKRWNAPK